MCHLSSGALFTDNSYRNNGIKPDTSLKDKGRGAITGVKVDDYTFKVPSLRNIEMTYPYMHDGRFRNLQQVMDHYASPEKYAANVSKEMYEIGNLSEQGKKDIIAFLHTLTDKSFIYDRRFVDPSVK